MKRTVLILVVAALGLSACATVPPKSDIAAYEEYKKNNDPLEPMNRGVFAFNTAIDNTLVRPVVKGYNKVAPEPLRHTVSNFLRNLKEPWTFINEILQGKPGDAIKTFSRFTLNTTLGIGGLNDLTDEVGMKHTEEDFGQTLGVWGAGEGFYLVLPGFGPSNLRDTAGIAADFQYDPVGHLLDKQDWGNNFFLGIDLSAWIHKSSDLFDWRARNDDLLDDLYAAEDPYVTARSAYRQKRRFEISDGKDISSDEEEDLFDEDIDWGN